MVFNPRKKFRYQPSWVAGNGVGKLAEILKSNQSTVISCVGDSKTETYNPVTTSVVPHYQTWTGALQRYLNQFKDTFVIDIPATYHTGSSNGVYPTTVLSGSINTQTPRQCTLLTASGHFAYYFPTGLNHLALALPVGTDTFGTMRCSVYTGNKLGAVPAAGTTTDRVADVNTAASGLIPTKSTFFLAALRINSWSQDVDQKDADGVLFENFGNVIFKVMENVDAGVTNETGCTVVVYRGNVNTGINRLIGKIGGSTFQENYQAVLNFGVYGRTRDTILNNTAPPSTRDYFSATSDGQNLFAEMTLRWLKQYQPTKFGSTNIEADLGGQVAGFDNLVSIFSMYTNRGTLPLFSTITPAEIATEVALVENLYNMQMEKAPNSVFCYAELMSIGGDAGYRDYMAAMKTMILSKPNGVWISAPEFIAENYNMSLEDAQNRTTLEARLGSALVDAQDGSNLHTGTSGCQIEAEAIVGAFKWAVEN